MLLFPLRQGGCREGFYVCRAKPLLRPACIAGTGRRQSEEVGGTEKPAILQMSRVNNQKLYGKKTIN